MEATKLDTAEELTLDAHALRVIHRFVADYVHGRISVEEFRQFAEETANTLTIPLAEVLYCGMAHAKTLRDNKTFLPSMNGAPPTARWQGGKCSRISDKLIESIYDNDFTKAMPVTTFCSVAGISRGKYYDVLKMNVVSLVQKKRMQQIKEKVIQKYTHSETSEHNEND